MLAARDQENLVHGHQAAAASKPLNQGIKQLPPKTPGNKAPKTPFKIPLNDENGPARFAKSRPGINNGRANENLTTVQKKGALADKTAFITPSGPRNRAPLGLKTTNARTKVFQTPAPVHDNEAKDEEAKSASARKPKPKVFPAEMTKVEIPGDKDKLEESEIEYMPPRAKDMPDYPDDMPHDLDFSMFENGGLTRGFMHHFATMVGDDGLSYYERKEQQRRKAQDLADKMADAVLLRDFESATIPCIHDPECMEMECTANIENKRAAEEKYRKTIARLSTSAKPNNPPAKKPLPPKGPPSTLNSKSAAAALSQPKPKAAAAPVPKPTSKPSSLPFSKPSAILTRPKRTPPPSNPSPMRHAAASAASKTTIGHSRGRIASAALKKKTPIPPPASSTNPHPDRKHRIDIDRYGVTYPEDEDEAEAEARAGVTALETMWREEAERDFFLVL
ncbi:hypothetical protein MMC07_007863 [Pseudocyphellaria aurata]|nr:hypothetical protein [Pseudocyphellaria aurata]